MNSKKNLIIGGIVIVVFIGGAFLLKDKFFGQSGEIGQPGVGIFSNKVTDDIYLKIMTDTAKITINNPGQTQETIASEMKSILSKYGISDVEFATYAQALSTDKVRSAAMQEKLVQIMSDLFKTKIK